MKLAGIACLSIVVAAYATGCTVKADDEDSLSTAESAIVTDSDEADDQEQQTEANVEEPLGGSDPATPGAPVDPAADQTMLEGAIKTNPGKFFKPAGCIQTTVAGNVATHVFTNCTGPYGLVTLNGTVTSTWSREGADKLKVVHSTTDFKIGKSTISGTSTNIWSKSGTTYTRTRNASWSGKTGKDKDFTRTATSTISYDTATKCIERDGSASTTIGARGLDSSITDYKRCGVGAWGCPQSGTIVLTAKAQNLTLTVEFLGGRKVRVTRPNGRVVDFNIFCRESA
jgi:hypothetical protein